MLRIELTVGEQGTVYEIPVNEERPLQGIDGTTRHPEHRVTPRLSLRTFHIAQGKVHTADESNLAVDDDDLTVVTVVHLTRERREVYRHKRHHLDTLLTHPLEELALDIPTAHIVVDDSYLHPLTGLGDEGIGNQRAQGIVGKDIHIHVDMTAGLTDLLQQGREELIAVGIDVHLIIFER